MKQLTATGLTVDDAVEKALMKLEASIEEVEIEVINEGKKGFLGIFGQKPAVVNVSVLVDPIKEAQAFLESVLDKMGVAAKVESKKDGRNISFQITGEKVAVLIGKRGQTLNSLEYLTQLAANKNSSHYIHVTVDAENYRQRREETLIQLAEKLARQAIATKKRVALEPMPANERKIIHGALASEKQITTCSEGEGSKRHIVISPKLRKINTADK
ncbi:KH domain-containing protein [Bacillus lacus]|uniref:RNA-binding protein KhpB n=1 Tax=Metabacillus lacus TaxID=1983721 RepID=A0A7X2M1B5_9BACI|nr:KH domain-containing protein [Metabacillus lacus]